MPFQEHARKAFSEGEGVRVAQKSRTLNEMSADLLYTLIPALMEGLERQGRPNSVISETVFLDNVQHFIPGEEN